MRLKNLFAITLAAVALVAGPIPQLARAEDASTDLVSEKISIRLAGAFFHQFSFNEGARVRLPPSSTPRRSGEIRLQELWNLDGDQATDSPMGHGASFIEFAIRNQASRDLQLDGSLVADLRGYSFGVYNQDQVSIYPKYHVDYLWHSSHDKSWTHRLPTELAFEAGTFQEARHYEGLQLYNIDYQAVYTHAQVGRWRLSFIRIGDLREGIGLGINDWLDYMVSVEDWAFREGWVADVRFGVTDYADFQSGGWRDVWNASLGIEKNNSRYYGQLSYRPFEGSYDWRLKYGSVLGATYSSDFDAGSISSRLEWRHYGGIFNDELSQPTQVHYRNTNTGSFGNYIGSQLYPLEAIDRPFSQWAVFTEYDKRYVDGVTLQTDVNIDWTKSLSFRFQLDLNAILAEGEDPFLYPFFSVGPEFRATEDAYLSFSLTNKTMNLDKHYPTYYFLRRPLVQFEVRRALD